MAVFQGFLLMLIYKNLSIMTIL